MARAIDNEGGSKMERTVERTRMEGVDRTQKAAPSAPAASAKPSSASSAPKEKTQEQKDKEAEGEFKGELRKSTKKIEQAGISASNRSGENTSEYVKSTEDMMKETQKLSKWNEGLVSSYEGIAKRYRDAFDQAEKLRENETKMAQRDYAANAAMMSKAAAVGMSGAGPMTGGQQQMMMATAQQQATSAYSTAQDRIAAMEMQRKQLGADVVQSSMSQEMQARQLGYNMDAQSINARLGMSRDIYGAKQQQVETQFGAETYGAQADLSIANAGMQYGLGMRGMREGQANAAAQIAAAQNMPQAYQGSTFGNVLTRGLSGAAAGAAIGTATGGPIIGTAIGAGVGLLSGIFS